MFVGNQLQVDDQYPVASLHHGSKAATSTTAGKLQKFYTEHTTPTPRAGRLSPTNAGPLPTGRLKTGQDVLQYFATNGLDAVPKLVHCVPTAPTAVNSTAKPVAAAQGLGDGHGPYDICVVSRNRLPASYLTVSATGVVEVPGDGTPSIHTPVGTWARHASLHDLLSGLTAGQQMLKGSTLHSWRTNAQQQRFQRRRQQLSQRLLLLKPSFHRVLGECRSKLAQLHAEGPLAAMEEGLFRLEALVNLQQEYQQSKLAPLLSRAVTGVVSDVEQLAQRLQSSERLLRREVQEYKKDPSAGASQGLCSIKIKAERAAVTGKHTIAVQDLHRLPSFLRMLAQIILQSQLDLLVAAVSGLRGHLQLPGNHLQVDLQLQGPEGVTMNPSQDETLKALSKGVLEHMVGVLIAAPRLLKHATIAALLSDPIHTVMNTPNNRGSMSGGCFTSSDGGSGAGLHMASAVVSGQALKAAAAAAAQGAAAVTLSAWLSEGEGQGGQREGGQLLMMVVGDKNLQSFRRALDQHVMRSYREAQQVADALGELGVLLKFACMWDPKAYKARQHTVAGLRKDALLIREWQVQLQIVLDSQSVGMLRLETGSLKATYTSTLSSAQATIAMLMVVAGRRAAEAAIDKLQGVSRDLAQQPSKLPDFISFRLAVRAVRQQQEDLLVALPAQVSDLYITVTAWGFRLPHTDQALLEDLKEACRGCSAALTAAVAFLDSRQLGMVALLDRQAKDVLRQVQELLKDLEDTAMTRRLRASSTAPCTAGAGGAELAAQMYTLEAQSEQLSQLSKTAAAINSQEQLLDMRCTHFADLDEARHVMQEMQQQAAL